MSAPFDPHRRGPQHPTYDGANYPNPPNQPQQFIPQQPQQFGGYSSPPFQGGNVGGKFGQPHGYPGGPQGFAAGGDGGAFFGPSLPSAQLGLHLGTQALSVGQDYVNKNVC